MSRRRYLAVTQLELDLELGEGAGAPRHRLRALLFDPLCGWDFQELDVSYPGSAQRANAGQFIVSAVGDVDGDGRPEIVYAVTVEPSACHVLAYRHDGQGWRCLPVVSGLPHVDLVRSMAIGDLDVDGVDEIVLATRPNGAVLVLDRTPAGYLISTVDRDQYGAGTTNTREVAVADVDSDGNQEILIATAQADSKKWQATPGSIFLYRRSANGWDRTLIEDHDGRTHTRMVAVADVRNDGINRIVSSSVGVIEPGSGRVCLDPQLRMYTLGAGRVTCERIGTLENMIKSRSFAAGDIDSSGQVALVVGTRAPGAGGLDTTCLFAYRFDQSSQSWGRETLDTSGPFGFHCVAIADVDGDGRLEIIASDDGRGLLKLYKKQGAGWQQSVIYAARTPIFCAAIHAIDLETTGC